MRRIELIICMALSAVMICTGSALAVPTLGDILGNSAMDGYSDTGASDVTLSDRDGGGDDVTAFLLLEIAAYAGTNKFGIYDSSSGTTVGEMLQVFDGTDTAVTSTTLTFDIDAGTVTRAGGLSANIGTTFGFYLEVAATGDIYYSQANLNDGGFDHMLLFDTSDNTVGALLGSDVVIAMEDLPLGGDGDYNDMVVGMSDVTVPVPEPATMFLLGSGLLGMAATRRKEEEV